MGRSKKEGNIKFVEFVVRHPFVVVFLTMGIATILSIIAVAVKVNEGTDLFQTPRVDADLSHITTKQAHAYELAVEDVFGKQEDDEEQDANLVVAQQTESGDSVLMVFEANGEQFFTREILKKTKAIQDKLTSQADYGKYCQFDASRASNTSLSDVEKCSSLLSPLNMFYASVWEQAKVDKLVNTIKEIDDFSDKAKGIMSCVQDLPQVVRPLIAVDAMTMYATGEFAPRNESDSEVVALLNAMCPKLKVTDLALTARTYGAVLEAIRMAGDFDGKGTQQDPQKVKELAAVLLLVPPLRPLVDFYFSSDFGVDKLDTKYSRMLIKYGLPLEGFNNKDDRREEQSKKFNDWFQKEFRTYLQSDTDHPDFNAYYFSSALFQDEILNILLTDALKALGSMAFVFGYLVFQTGSVFLGIAGMMEIIMSLPFAYAMYTLIFQFSFLGTFCSMCIYIVLAIGADDIFVFMDAYKQSALEGPQVLESVEARFSWVYRRAASAMLITSFTTMVAFIATAVSPLPSVQSFGIYSAFVILADFIFVITFFPACVVIYHDYMELKGCCAGCKCCGKLQPTSTEKYRNGQDKPPIRKLEVILVEHVAPFITRRKFILMAAFLVWLIVNCILSAQVEASTASDQFLPEDHPFQKILTIQSSHFGASSQDSFNEIILTWGVEDVDRDGVALLFDSEYLGKTEFKNDFELNESGQLHLLSVCENLETKEFVAKDKFDPLKAAIRCPIADLKTWSLANAKSFPVPANELVDRLEEFLAAPVVHDGKATTYGYKFDNMLGIKNKKVKFILTIFESQLAERGQYSKTRLEQEYEKMQEYVKEVNVDTPTSLGPAFQTDKAAFWIRMRNQQIYVQSAITGAITGTILAFVVILFATRCIRVAFLASLTICGILLSVLALMVAIGWQLGTIESINLTILAGFSVDYVVHLAHAYVQSHSELREDRVHDAVAEMGISVLSGMVTSVGASLLLFACQLQFFAKFGGFLCSTIAFSWLWANFFFLSALAAIGPQKDDHEKSKYFYL